MTNKLVKKHDELSKKVLTDLNMAGDFLRIHLDGKIIAKCDLCTLCIELPLENHHNYMNSQEQNQPYPNLFL